MELDSRKGPVWQYGASVEKTADGERFHYGIRYHCFVDNKALCKDYTQDTLEHGEKVTGKVERIAKLPDLIACKKCWRAWQRKYAETAKKVE